ncbi:MAG: M48 family metallopeptidase [Vicinamibacterales bacterium]
MTGDGVPGTQLPLPYAAAPRAGDAVSVPGVAAAVVFVRQRRARHYILRLRADGVVRVTVPWRGSRAEAERFLLARRAWVDRQRQRRELALEAARLPLEDEARLRTRAAQELPARLRELAAIHGFAVSSVSVRNQRTRWGSCSPSGRISLNWRLIQVPPAVCDYVLLHELTHLRHLNHSARFWQELARLCPDHAEARTWLRSSGLLAC